MPRSFTITLAAWSDLIVPAIVVASVVGSWIHNALKKYNEQHKAELGEGQDEFEQRATHRREQLMQAARQRPQAGARPGLGSSPDSNLSMADRIARARVQAQQAQRPSRPAGQTQPQPQDSRLQQALAQRRAQLRQQQLTAQAQQRAQQQTQQRARQQRAQAHARAQAQARQHGTLLHEPGEAPQQAPPSVRKHVPKKTKATRQPVPELIPEAPAFGSALIGKLSRNDLRKAIVLNEILGKPIALRDE